MTTLLKYTAYFLFLPIWWIQLLIPRKKDIWVFGAWYGNRFSDNSKYLYLYVVKNHPEKKAIWLTRERTIAMKVNEIGGKSFLAGSILGIYYSLLAKVVIISSGKKDINPLFIHGATWVQLWHGNPMKKICLDDPYSKQLSFFHKNIVRPLLPYAAENNYDLVVSNAEIFSDKMSSAFGVDPLQILETGCPRNDIFFDTQDCDFTINLKKKFPRCRIVFYLPTFRSEQTQSLFNLESFDRERLHSFLEKENIVFVNKGHYVDDTLNGTEVVYDDRLINLSDSEVDDINLLLKDADLLVTDYSGAYFDFLLLKRPVVFAAFDLEEYQSSSRQMYFDYNSILSGPIVKNWEELLSSLTTIWTNEQFRKETEKKNEIFNKFHDAGNSERVYKAITERI